MPFSGLHLKKTFNIFIAKKYSVHLSQLKLLKHRKKKKKKKNKQPILGSYKSFVDFRTQTNWYNEGSTNVLTLGQAEGLV